MDESDRKKAVRCMMHAAGERLRSEDELAKLCKVDPSEVEAIGHESPELFHTTEDPEGNRYYLRRINPRDPRVETSSLNVVCLRCRFDLGHGALGNEQARQVACPKCGYAMMVYARADGYRIVEAHPVTPQASTLAPQAPQAVRSGVLQQPSLASFDTPVPA